MGTAGYTALNTTAKRPVLTTRDRRPTMDQISYLWLSHGRVLSEPEPGVAPADRARQAGATEAEIAAVVEICYVNGGLQRLSGGFEALATDQTSEGDD